MSKAPLLLSTATAVDYFPLLETLWAQLNSHCAIKLVFGEVHSYFGQFYHAFILIFVHGTPYEATASLYTARKSWWTLCSCTCPSTFLRGQLLVCGDGCATEGAADSGAAAESNCYRRRCRYMFYLVSQSFQRTAPPSPADLLPVFTASPSLFLFVCLLWPVCHSVVGNGRHRRLMRLQDV